MPYPRRHRDRPADTNGTSKRASSESSKKSPSRSKNHNDESSKYGKTSRSQRASKEPTYETIASDRPPPPLPQQNGTKSHHHHQEAGSELRETRRHRDHKSGNHSSARPHSAPSIKVERCPDERLENGKGNYEHRNSNNQSMSWFCILYTFNNFSFVRISL